MKLAPKPHCNPEALGALCHLCPLQNKAVPVPSEVRPSSLALLVEHPSGPDEVEGRPLAGASGALLRWAVKGLGFARSDVAVLSTLLCRPPNPKTFRPEQWKKAIECCRPRLEAELSAVAPKLIFAAGNRALQATVGKASVTPWYGSPLDSKYGPVFPSVSFNFVRNKPAYMPVFKRWLRTVWEISTGRLAPWDWGRLKINPTVADLQELLAAGLPLGLDIENDGDPLDPNVDMLCVGVGNVNCSVSIDWSRLAAEPELDVAFRALLDSPLPKVLLNAQHDILGLESKGYAVLGPIEDLLLKHAVLAPQLEHGLSHVAAFETHADRWKSTFKAGKEDKSSSKEKGVWLRRYIREPEVVRTYNAKDTSMSARLDVLLSAQL